MAYVLIKRGKFLEGHSYATGGGYSFTWTNDEAKARRFADGEPADHFRAMTKGRWEHRKNNRAELRAIAKERREYVECGFRPRSVHDRINQRAAAAKPIPSQGTKEQG